MDLFDILFVTKRANKYTDSQVTVKDVQTQSGTSVVNEDKIAVLPTDLEGVTDVKVNGTSVVTDSVANLNMKVNTEAGAFGIRFYNGLLQYHNGSEWVTIPLANQTI